MQGFCFEFGEKKLNFLLILPKRKLTGAAFAFFLSSFHLSLGSSRICFVRWTNRWNAAFLTRSWAGINGHVLFLFLALIYARKKLIEIIEKHVFLSFVLFIWLYFPFNLFLFFEGKTFKVSVKSGAKKQLKKFFFQSLMSL